MSHYAENTQVPSEFAWKIHRENGHPEGYDGPCWGPTLAETEEAKRLIARLRDTLHDVPATRGDAGETS